MLNNKKIRTMTRLAIYEGREGKEDLNTGHYYKLDYIRFHLLKTFVCYTMGYLLILSLVGLYKIEYLINNAVTLDYKQIGTTILGIYLILAVTYTTISIFIYSVKFVKAKKRLGGYNRKLKELHQIYKDEENV